MRIDKQWGAFTLFSLGRLHYGYQSLKNRQGVVSPLRNRPHTLKEFLILKREGVSVYRLRKDLGIDRGELSRFFHGKQNISLPKLEQIADYLGCDIEFVKRKRSRKGG